MNMLVTSSSNSLIISKRSSLYSSNSSMLPNSSESFINSFSSSYYLFYSSFVYSLLPPHFKHTLFSDTLLIVRQLRHLHLYSTLSYLVLTFLRPLKEVYLLFFSSS
jgi:hypothetical protein